MLQFTGKFIHLIIFFQKSFFSRKSMFSEISRKLGKLRVSSDTLVCLHLAHDTTSEKDSHGSARVRRLSGKI